MQMQDKEKRRPTSAGRRFSCQKLLEVPRQGHDGRDNGQRGRLTAEDAGAEANGLCAGFCGHLSFLGGKAALCAGDDGELQLLAVGGLCLGQQLAKGRAAAFVAEEHEVVLSEAAADCAEVGQRKGHIRQDAPAVLLAASKAMRL